MSVEDKKQPAWKPTNLEEEKAFFCVNCLNCIWSEECLILLNFYASGGFEQPEEWYLNEEEIPMCKEFKLRGVKN